MKNGIGAKPVLVYGKRIYLDVVTVIKSQEVKLGVEKQTHLIV
tara:strand:+ start:246 stop:374 length:129 start_codon:yes stop_codon:yes gene_type:complete